MAADLIKALSKLDRPPSAVNWARFVHESRPKTTKSIVSFVTGIPQVVYSAGYTAIRDRLNLAIKEEMVIGAAARAAPKSRAQNVELVQAFLNYEAERNYPLATNIEFDRQWFPISRELGVPVAPLTILRENGQFLPIFVCGWSDLALTPAQCRLLMTVIEDAFLSLTDFQSSPAEFLFFPRVKHGELKGERRPVVWKRGEFDLLSQAQLEEQVETYLASRDDARAVILAKKAEDDRLKDKERRDRPEDGNDLFGWSEPKK